jgi:hypothetical protein
MDFSKIFLAFWLQTKHLNIDASLKPPSKIILGVYAGMKELKLF